MAAASSAVRNALSPRFAGRSSGVIVAFSHMPWRSGSPHAVFDGVYGLAAGRAPAAAARSPCAAAPAGNIVARTMVRTPMEVRHRCFIRNSLDDYKLSSSARERVGPDLE